MSYRKKLIKNKIKNITPKKSIFSYWWLWVVILDLVLLFGGVYCWIFLPQLQIKNINISGNNGASAKDIQQLVLNKIDWKIINFLGIQIDSRSIFLANDSKLEKDILSNFSDIEKVSVKKDFPQALNISISERQPVALFCDNSNTCSFIDQNGVTFGNNINQNDFMIIKNESGNVISKDNMDEIIKTNNLLENYKINIKQALISTPVKLDIQTGEGWQIYFNISDNSSFAMEITKLNLLLAGQLALNKRNNLIYIDLRPSDRAIICDNETCRK